jgi:hypothetical protein
MSIVQKQRWAARRGKPRKEITLRINARYSVGPNDGGHQAHGAISRHGDARPNIGSFLTFGDN